MLSKEVELPLAPRNYIYMCLKDYNKKIYKKLYSFYVINQRDLKEAQEMLGKMWREREQGVQSENLDRQYDLFVTSKYDLLYVARMRFFFKLVYVYHPKYHIQSRAEAFVWLIKLFHMTNKYSLAVSQQDLIFFSMRLGSMI